jgi:CRP/FNR family transcriptional regulator, cyclic AMP receptor protein
LELAHTYLARHAYFHDLAPEELAQVARLAVMRTLTRGEVLALEGDPCVAVYFVVQGRVHAVKTSPQGREQVVSELQVGEAFYIVPALDGAPLPVTTRAATRATLLSIACADLRDVIKHHPAVAMQVLMDFARRLRRLTTLVEDLSLRSVSARLARLLIEHAQPPTNQRMTQREMAAQLGTVREVLARTLGQFERKGWVRLQRGVIEIIDAEALREVAGL